MSALPYFPPYPGQHYTGLAGNLYNDLTSSGARPELVGTQLIVFASLLTQGVADVMAPNAMKKPVGGSGWIVAPSALGKSLICRIFADPIEQYLDMRSRVDSTEVYSFLIEDSNREALVQSMSEWPVAAVITDEAGQLRQLLKNAPTLVKLTEGSSFRAMRVSTGRVMVRRPRLCLLIMEQPGLFDTTKVLMGAHKGGVGLGNRTFAVRIDDSTPSRPLGQVGLSAATKTAYESRLGHLLDQSIANVAAKLATLPVVKLSAEATAYFYYVENETHRNNKPGSPYFFISEYIARHPERALRHAGAMHVFEHGTQGEISLETLQRATLLGEWYIQSYANMLYEPPKLSQAETDAIDLDNAIRHAHQVSGHTVFRHADIRVWSLNLGLTPSRFTRALALLAKQARVHVFTQQRVLWIAINTCPVILYS